MVHVKTAKAKPSCLSCKAIGKKQHCEHTKAFLDHIPVGVEDAGAHKGSNVFLIPREVSLFAEKTSFTSSWFFVSACAEL